MKNESVRQLSSAWKPTETIPNDIHTIKYDGLDDDRKQAFDRKTLDDRINENVTFITKDHKLIYPELKVNQRIGSDAKSNQHQVVNHHRKKSFRILIYKHGITIRLNKLILSFQNKNILFLRMDLFIINK